MSKNQTGRVEQWLPRGSGQIVTNDGTLLPIDDVEQVDGEIERGDSVKFEVGKDGAPVHIRRA